MAERQPGQGRYAHPEREQRWIAKSVPPGATLVASMVDRYIIGTRLRLRRAEGPLGVVYKLGQKVRDDPGDPETVRLTNMYLSEDEYNALLVLPAAELHKARSRTEWAGRLCSARCSSWRGGGHRRPGPVSCRKHLVTTSSCFI